MSGSKSDPMDELIGRNVRLYRAVTAVSQAALARAIGVSAQQVQKYESGSSRVSASTLFRIAGALQIPVSRFFEEPERFADRAEHKFDRSSSSAKERR